MAPDPSVASLPNPTSGTRDKVRLRFRKDGSLRWLSHHDLMRTFERMLRRAELPFRQSQGFHPHPRLVFALSLPVGVVGRNEIADLELDELLPVEQIHARLSSQCPPGLAILSVERVPLKQSARVVGFTYALEVPLDRRASTRAGLAEALAQSQWLVEREKPNRRTLDVRPFVRDLRLDDATGWFEMDLWLTPRGTARPEEVLGLAGLSDLLEAGVTLERTRLVLDTDDSPTEPS